ncbi:unnamed protein product, partial [Didymodactylos carnosus]
MMSITLSNGYVLDTSGPYPGSKNHALIAEHITKVNEHLAQWCRNDAAAIVDRGFDRERTVFEDLGLIVKMPASLTSKQHSWEEANQPRLITK